MDEGHIVVDSIVSIDRTDITDELALESGFKSAVDLLETASHGGGNHVYLIRFHYLPPGAWDERPSGSTAPQEKTTLLQRIRRSGPPELRAARKKGQTPRSPRR